MTSVGLAGTAALILLLVYFNSLPPSLSKEGSDFFLSSFLFSSMPPISLNRLLTGQGMSGRSLNFASLHSTQRKLGESKEFFGEVK